MRITIILDNGFKYTMTVDDSSITLAEFLTDLYIGLKQSNQLNYPTLSAYPKYLKVSQEKIAEVQHLDKPLHDLLPEEDCQISLTNKHSRLSIALFHAEDLSVTTLLHFITTPDYKNISAARQLLNIIFKDSEDAYGNIARHFEARLGTKLLDLESKNHNINKRNRVIQTFAKFDEGFGNTPLHLAAFHGHSEYMQILINAGADVNATNQTGKTPLHLSARRGQETATRILLDAKAKVNFKDKEGATPLHYALTRILPSSLAVMNELLDHKADVNAINIHKHTPLRILCEELNGCRSQELELALKIIQKLIDRQADINVQDRDGKTALHHVVAAQLNNNVSVLQIIDFLIKKGAYLNIVDNQGFTPFCYLKKHRSQIWHYLVDGSIEPAGSLSERWWQEYLKRFVIPIFEEIRPLLLLNIRLNLPLCMPIVLIELIQSYVPPDLEDAAEEKEILKLARLRAESLPHENKHIENDFKITGDHFWPPITLDVMNNFIAALLKQNQQRFQLSPKVIQQLQNISAQPIQESKKNEKFQSWLQQYWNNKRGQLLGHLLQQQQKSPSSSPLQPENYQQYLARKIHQYLLTIGLVNLGTGMAPEEKKPSPSDYGAFFSKTDTAEEPVSEQIGTLQQLKEQLLIVAKLLRKNANTVQGIADAKNLRELPAYITSADLTEELERLHSQLMSIPESQRGITNRRGISFNSAIQIIGQGFNCVETLKEIEKLNNLHVKNRGP